MGSLLLFAQEPEVVFVDHAKVAEALSKTGMLSRNADHMVAGAHRNGPGQAERHDKTYDIVYVTDGEATYVTGGKLMNSKQTGPGEMLGGTIDGGKEYHLTKGDVIVVPPGVPHWFKEVPKEVSYFLVKVNKQ
jgi:quercetin dioxygenase-like cupin family protein